MNDIMLDNLLASISNDPFNVTNGNHDDDQEGDTTKKQCENELYQLLLGTEFKMKMQNVESKVLQLSFVLVEIISRPIHESRKACHQVSCCPCNICSI